MTWSWSFLSLCTCTPLFPYHITSIALITACIHLKCLHNVTHNLFPSRVALWGCQNIVLIIIRVRPQLESLDFVVANQCLKKKKKSQLILLEVLRHNLDSINSATAILDYGSTSQIGAHGEVPWGRGVWGPSNRIRNAGHKCTTYENHEHKQYVLGCFSSCSTFIMC